MKITGQCHCGAIAYEAEITLENVKICHCTDCQILSGTAYRVIVPVDDDSFRLTKGELKIYRKTAESGNIRKQSFCENCGTPVYSAPDDGKPGRINIRTGSVNEKAELIPTGQIWARSAQGWVEDLSALPASATE